MSLQEVYNQKLRREMKLKIFVLPVENGWAVKRDGLQEPISIHKTKEEAVERGMAEARMNEAALFVRSKKGVDELKKDFGNEPAI